MSDNCFRTSKSRYRTLTCDVASTIPCRNSGMDEWVRVSVTPQLRPVSFIEGSYSGRGSVNEEDLEAMQGLVQRWRKYYSSQPLASSPTTDRPSPQKDNRFQIITYNPKKTFARRYDSNEDRSRYSDRNSAFEGQISRLENETKSGEGRKSHRRHSDVSTRQVWKTIQSYEEKMQQDQLENIRYYDIAKETKEQHHENDSFAWRTKYVPATNVPAHIIASCRSGATANGRGIGVDEAPAAPCEYQHSDSQMWMCEGNQIVSPVPRVIGISFKSYKDIPTDVFDSLPESSVDPSPDETGRNMRNGLGTWSAPECILNGRPHSVDLSKKDRLEEGHFGNEGLEIGGISSPRMGDGNKISAPLPPRRKYIGSAKYPSPQPRRSTLEQKKYLKQLEHDLQKAGIYFRRPTDVTVALATLDASLEGFSTDSSSSQSSDSSCHPCRVVFSSSESDSSQSPEAIHARPEAIRATPEAIRAKGLEEKECDNAFRKDIDVKANRSCDTSPNIVNDVPVKDLAMPIVRDSGQRANAKATVENAVENYNLIEEVYVTTKTKEVLPKSTVEMKAYYPGINFSEGETASAFTPHGDSDSGHESGATSPCGTITGGEDASPPPSPLTPKLQSLAYENHLRRISREATEDRPESASKDIAAQGKTASACAETTQIFGAVVRQVAEDDYINVPVNPQDRESHCVVVAIDFGTTYSGYAFSFTNDPDNTHMMKKWEGGDPGIQNQKAPTIVLLNPDETFHSLGFTARDTYHDLDPVVAQKWLYFDKFKMELHSDQPLTSCTLLEAKNGKRVSALKIFSFALQYFRDHALRELSELMGVEVEEEDIRWVITVPAIWSHPAKQFMRMAAYKASMGSTLRPDRLLIALEPEAAAIYCRRLRQNQLIQDKPSDPSKLSSKNQFRALNSSTPELSKGTTYMVVDCGGGTVDITVHQMTDRRSGLLKEVVKATGGPYGSTGVDREFEKLMDMIFGSSFMNLFKAQRSAAYVDLMVAFEARKRNASPYKSTPLNISLPFAFIDFFKKTTGKEVESAIKKRSNLGVRWSSQGMLRIEMETMKQLFQPTLQKVTQAIENVLSSPELECLQYLFLVGGFAESELLQRHIRDHVGRKVNVIIPQGMGLAILRGAVQFGLDPSVVTIRRSRFTYGVGVLNKFELGVHPSGKKVVADGIVWCADVLDVFVRIDESVAVGDTVTRSYTPASAAQKSVILHLYAADRDNAKFVTDEGVKRVGTLQLELGTSSDSVQEWQTEKTKREITVHLKFGGTEVTASAVDQWTGQSVRANIEFMAM